MTATTCQTGPDFDAARRAALWVANFYPDVTVTLDRQNAQLVSTDRDAPALRLIWCTSLANERLFADAADARAQLIAELVG